jgi:hypothetical protein
VILERIRQFFHANRNGGTLEGAKARRSGRSNASRWEGFPVNVMATAVELKSARPTLTVSPTTYAAATKPGRSFSILPPGIVNFVIIPPNWHICASDTSSPAGSASIPVRGLVHWRFVCQVSLRLTLSVAARFVVSIASRSVLPMAS